MPDDNDAPQDPNAIAVHYQGQDTYMTPEQLALAGSLATPITAEQASVAHGHQIRAEKASGIGGALKAGVGALVGGSTLGLVNPWEEEQQFNPGAAALGTVASYVAPFLIPGAEEAKAAEALAEPTAAEHIASALSSNYLHAGEMGAEGGAGRAMESTMLRGKAGKLAGEVGEEVAERGLQSQLAPDQIAQMTAPQLKEARTAEVANIKAQRQADVGQIIKDLGAHRDASWMPLEGADAKAIVGETGGAIGKSGGMLRDMLDVPKTLARDPKRMLYGLERQETALERLGEHEPALRDLFASDETGERAAQLDKLPAALENNRALQARIQAAIGPDASPALDAIDAAKERLMTPRAPEKEGIAQQLLGGKVFEMAEEKSKELFGSLPFIGPVIGSKAAELAKSLLFGHGAEAVGEGVEKAGEIAKQFVSKAKGPVGALTASHILASAKFGDNEEVPGEKAGKGDLAESFAKRTAEIKAKTMYDPMGQPVMRPEARQEMANRLAPIRMAAPVLADRIETVAARKIEFLSSKIPRLPDLPGLAPGAWRPSDIDMRTFARYVDAVEHPQNVEQRLLAGTLSPEDAEAYRAVYPERHAQLTQLLVQEMTTAKGAIPYARRMSMSIFTGTPCDPSLDPQTIATFQGHFARENGSLGGSSNPTPSPAFGSIKKSAPEPTPADKRAQGVG
jgi:hypothetical protein